MRGMKSVRGSDKKRLLGLTMCLVMLVAAAGCGKEERESPQRESQTPEPSGGSGQNGIGAGDGTASGESIDDEGAVSGAAGAASQTDRTAGMVMWDFGLRLLQGCLGVSQDFPPYASMPESVYAASRENGNLLVSPVSIASALAMTANGAQGDTLRQMETALGLSAQELDDFFLAYGETLSPEDGKCRLSIADSIWFTADERFTVDEEFLRTNQAFFGASFFREPFDGSTADRINGWVEEHTEGLIREILDEIPGDAVMYLVNALAFDGEWEDIYKSNQVREGNFTKEDGTVQKADMMYSAERKYLKGEGAEGFLKYYAEGRFAFAALLPQEGTSAAEYVSALTGEELGRILEQAEDMQVNAAIPKFQAEYGVLLNSVLQEMGIVDAFDIKTADFSRLGYSEAGNIYIGRVLHKTYVAVDERGTKAGAATAVEMLDNAAMIGPGESRTVYLDRPFVYMIIDCEKGIPLFMGTVADLDG